nr:hypothetical protein [Tanacetum cinerariifolium]
MKILVNKLESLKLLNNKLESMKILENKLELLKLQENQPVDGLVSDALATREYPSLIHTFFLTYTVGSVFLNPEDKALYDEMPMLQGLGSNTPTGHSHSSSISKHALRRITRLKKSEKRLTKQVNMFMRLFRSDDKFSQMLSQLESQPEYGGGSGSGGCGDDEPGDDEDDGEDADDS